MDQAAVLSEARKPSGSGDGLLLAPVDLKHLRRYTLGDPSLEREVLDLFLAQLPTTIAALGAARTQKDWKVAAHTLKGSGRAVGAWRIARIAEQAEHSQGIASPTHVRETVGLLEAAAKEAKDFIAATYG
ncbi:MAG TPA: Hpt domain-containing protein [Hyphomicrobium sp.]|nr:Hpt domain-containing protein [Hyphomicrobium sp.]